MVTATQIFYSIGDMNCPMRTRARNCIGALPLASKLFHADPEALSLDLVWAMAVTGETFGLARGLATSSSRVGRYTVDRSELAPSSECRSVSSSKISRPKG